MLQTPIYTFFLVSLFLVTTHLEAKTTRYRLTVRDDPATTVCIGWEQLSGSDPEVWYGPEDQGQQFELYPFHQKPDRALVYKDMDNRFVRLTGLKPQTRYYFVIHDSEGVSRRFWFETLPDNPEVKLSLIAGGDARGSGLGDRSIDPRIKTNRLVALIQPHLVIFGGDFTLRDSEGQWESWFDDWRNSFTEDGKITALVPARGNHEDSDDILYNLFDISSRKGYYSLTLGGSLVQLYTLNTLISVAGDQTTWLRRELEQNDRKQTWRIVQYHQPMFPHHERKRIRPDIYQNWAQLFYDYRVKLVIECDAHVVKSTWPLKPSTDPKADHGFVRSDADGTYYCGEGTWALTRKKIKRYTWTRGVDSFLQFRWIVVSREEMLVRTIRVESSQNAQAVSADDRYSLPPGMVEWIPGSFTIQP